MIRACIRHAEGKGSTVPADLRDEAAWRLRHSELEQDHEADGRRHRETLSKAVAPFQLRGRRTWSRCGGSLRRNGKAKPGRRASRMSRRAAPPSTASRSPSSPQFHRSVEPSQKRRRKNWMICAQSARAIRWILSRSYSANPDRGMHGLHRCPRTVPGGPGCPIPRAGGREPARSLSRRGVSAGRSARRSMPRLAPG
jgi:hypothetical protein